jgi:mannitol/fructose-specific phosphotransferase system IIA component (Ntr-type)
MKLSELSTDRATDVLCELTPYITNILSDEALLSELRTAIDFKEANTLAEKMALTASKITNIIPILLKNRKSDVFGILGALNEKSVEEIAKQNFIKTMKQIKDIAKDKELLDFFKSCTDTEESE